MSEACSSALVRGRTVAEWVSDPNSGHGVRAGQPSITDLAKPQVQGSDPNNPGPDSAGRIDAAASCSDLWHRIRSTGISTLAVMGMSKNTGKTVALNHLLAQAAKAGVTVGVSSIGRDGEDRDQVFFIPKPAIRVWPGTLVATASATLARAKVRCQRLASTGIASAMGEIVIVKVLDRGEMEIAGACHGSDQRRLIDQLRQRGAALVLLDGALGRSHHASPAIADGVLLATGAALGGSMADVIRKTRDRLAILRIAPVDEVTRVRCAPLFVKGGVGLWNQRGELVFEAEIATLNAAATLLQPIDAELATIALSGAVGRVLWQALLILATRHPGLTVVVADGSKLFIDSADLLAFQKLGARLLAWRGIHIVGITLNPYSPLGSSFAAEQFLAAARQAFPDYAVSDVVWEESKTVPDSSVRTRLKEIR